jgi:hypothetical protein
MPHAARRATALEWHLAVNLHPSMVPELAGPCVLAIDCVAAGVPDTQIIINGHVAELDGQPLTAARLVDELRLEDFLPGGSAA